MVSDLLRDRAVSSALAWLDAHAAEITAEQIALCQIPAPVGAEGRRAREVAARLRRAGLRNVALDDAGNVVALRRGVRRESVVVLCAHLDTVFPAETNVTVRREGTLLRAPGISDNAAGLAALLAIARALRAGAVRTKAGLVFLATVGEEGRGDLRGVRHFFDHHPLARSVEAFVAIDGAVPGRIVNVGVRCRRFELIFRGPGGHSWADFGLPNPVHALAKAIACLAQYPAPEEPKTTFNVGVVQGGCSVNAIPEAARAEVDLRSLSEDELGRLEKHLAACLRTAAEEETGRAPGYSLATEMTVLSDRPGGETPADAPLVRAAAEAFSLMGIAPHLAASSTDANLPMSRGLPAVALPAGGRSGGVHTLDEWHDITGREQTLKALALVALWAAGLAPA